MMPEIWGCGAVAIGAAIVYGSVGYRVRDCNPRSARGSMAVAVLALTLAILIVSGMLSAVVGYSLLCVTLSGYLCFDRFGDERDRRRRVASLAPRPPAETAPAMWVFFTILSTALLGPYIVAGEQRAAAVLVACSAAIMAGLSWRIASSPTQLHGDDLPYEMQRDRADRIRSAGLAAVIAMGSVSVFISFVNADATATLPFARILSNAAWTLWAISGAWVIVYSARLLQACNTTA